MATALSLDGARIAVVGASGQIGRYLLPRLIGAGARPLAFSRRRPDWAGWLDLDWRCQPAETLRASALEGCAALIWIAPLNLFGDCAAALGLQRISRVVAFSSTSLSVKAVSPSAAERAMARLIARSEQALREHCRAAGCAWTLLRPTLIYGAGLDQNVSRLQRLIRRHGWLPLPFDCHGLRQPVHADDLAHACIQVLRSSAAAGRSYALPGGETLSFRALVERLFAVEGLPPRILPLPRALLALVLRLRGEDPALLARMAEDLVFDAEPAARDFGYQPRGFQP